MLTNLKKLWSILSAQEKCKSVFMMVLVCLMAFAETAGVISIMPFLAVLARPEVIFENSILNQTYELLEFENTQSFMKALGFFSIAMVVGSSVFKAVTLHILNRFTAFLRHSLSARLLERYLHQPYEFFLTFNTSILSKNVLSEVERLQGGLIQPVSQMFAQGAVVLAVVLLLFIYNPINALAIIVGVGMLYGFIYLFVRKRLVTVGEEIRLMNGLRFKANNEALSGIKDVKITHSADAYLEQYQFASRNLSRHQATANTLAQTPLYIVEAVGYTGLIILALLLMASSNDIAHVLPALGLYGFSAFRLLPSAQIMYRGFAQLKVSSTTLDNIYNDLHLKVEPLNNNAEALPFKHEISLNNIHYAYPSTPDKKVFNDFNLSIKANTSVGIKGKSGTGKSTLMDILLGLLHPSQGTFSIDGVEINEHNLGAWQKNIGYVPQHIYLADASVAENIAFGIKRENINQAALEKAAKAAQIHEFVVNNLEQGYNTLLGERGIRLSGGQRQRIGIARALYHDPSVLFMDEATSALDTETEAALNEAVQKLSGQKTIVVIAHREASLKYCDEVVELSADSNSTRKVGEDNE